MDIDRREITVQSSGAIGCYLTEFGSLRQDFIPGFAIPFVDFDLMRASGWRVTDLRLDSLNELMMPDDGEVRF